MFGFGAGDAEDLSQRGHGGERSHPVAGAAECVLAMGDTFRACKREMDSTQWFGRGGATRPGNPRDADAVGRSGTIPDPRGELSGDGLADRTVLLEVLWSCLLYTSPSPRD